MKCTIFECNALQKDSRVYNKIVPWVVIRQNPNTNPIPNLNTNTNTNTNTNINANTNTNTNTNTNANTTSFAAMMDGSDAQKKWELR